MLFSESFSWSVCIQPLTGQRSEIWTIMVTMRTMAVALLLLCVVQANTQEETEYGAKFSALDSRLSTCESKMATYESKMATYESKMATYESKMADRECMNKKFCERDGFTYGDGICYYISTEKKSWDESRQWCRDRQADLVVIKSKETQDLVASFNKWVWLGLTDRVTEGVFQWVDGTPLTTPTYWRPGDPQFETTRYPNDECDCVYLYEEDSAGDSPTPVWGDIQCFQSFHWMCERSLC